MRSKVMRLVVLVVYVLCGKKISLFSVLLFAKTLVSVLYYLLVKFKVGFYIQQVV